MRLTDGKQIRVTFASCFKSLVLLFSNAQLVAVEFNQKGNEPHKGLHWEENMLTRPELDCLKSFLRLRKFKVFGWHVDTDYVPSKLRGSYQGYFSCNAKWATS